MNISNTWYYSRRMRRRPQRCRGFRMTAATVVMVFVAGIFAGYILGLWQQIGQHVQ